MSILLLLLVHRIFWKNCQKPGSPIYTVFCKYLTQFGWTHVMVIFQLGSHIERWWLCRKTNKQTNHHSIDSLVAPSYPVIQREFSLFKFFTISVWKVLHWLEPTHGRFPISKCWPVWYNHCVGSNNIFSLIFVNCCFGLWFITCKI